MHDQAFCFGELLVDKMKCIRFDKSQQLAKSANVLESTLGVIGWPSNVLLSKS